MRLLTWNIQWGRGCDGIVNIARIADVIRHMGEFDVICLQEVAVNHPGLPGSSGENQPAMLAAEFPGYTAHYSAGSDLAAKDGSRRQFGNLLLSRLPVLQIFRHSLPSPAPAGSPSMPRVALEAVTACGDLALRIVTTHLEYYSVAERSAQIERLRDIHEEAFAHASNSAEGFDLDPPFQAPRRPRSSLYCGDFNCEPDAAERLRFLQPFTSGAPDLFDAWQITHPDRPH